MTKLEKVIKGLEICSEHGSWHGLNCRDNEALKDCPYRGCETGCIVTIAKDAIALLKGQEAVEPISSYGTFRCGNCKNIVGYNDGHGRGYQTNFCSECGKAVKWDAIQCINLDEMRE